MELVKDTINIENFPKTINANATMEGDIIVPDVKPDAEDIIKYDVRGFITESEINGNKIIFKGKIKLSIIYKPRSEESSAQSLRTEFMLNDFVTEENLENTELIHEDFQITDSMITVVNDRKLRYKINAVLKFLQLSSQKAEIVTNVENIPDDRLLHNTFKRCSCGGTTAGSFKVSEELTLGSDKDEIYEIWDVSILPQSAEAKPSEGKITVSGDLLLHILYMPVNSTEPDLLEYELPFNGSFDIPSANKDSKWDMRINVLDDKITIQADEDGEERIISFEVNMQALCRIYNTVETKYLDDAYAINQNADITRTEITYPVFICQNKNQFSVKENVELDEKEPPILRIYNISCNALNGTTEIYENKAVVEGVVEAKILYAAKDDSSPLCCHETMLPYRQTIELKGLNPINNPNISTNIKIEHISRSVLDSRELEVKPVLTVNVCVNEEQTVSLITDLKFEELSPDFLNNLASITLYVVKPGDSLWKIAKRYNSSVADILSVNNIENPDLIHPGDKIIIVKKAA